MSKSEKTEKITVVAKQASRMRAGFQFTTDPREVDLTEAQFEAIKSDPLLAIIEAAPEKKKS
jgi:hypothetical protein